MKTMNNPIRHIAGPYEDGMQQCTRCLKILIDHGNAVVMESDQRPLLGFDEGPVCDLGNFKYVEFDPDADAVDCVPMGEGL
ncbi:hypothetical protein LCGC14_1140920 [marine sediment metagenome]|uniref:Uncharacterized protein n=1 Tax=marine sediment metagenome TaxID=412755 RepID=A0A0F9Q414_9ZZZZ